MVHGKVHGKHNCLYSKKSNGFANYSDEVISSDIYRVFKARLLTKALKIGDTILEFHKGGFV